MGGATGAVLSLAKFIWRRPSGGCTCAKGECNWLREPFLRRFLSGRKAAPAWCRSGPLANGRGASLDPSCALAGETFLAVAEVAGAAAQGRILLAAPISLAEIEARFADQAKDWSARTRVGWSVTQHNYAGRFDASLRNTDQRAHFQVGDFPLVENFDAEANFFGHGFGFRG